ncbi:phosphoadenosine phosphosulfate reductase family protein [Halogeometricum luteum]|uniref:Phosphoadenosine phosphosulfate reductase family protein n=1 Tax=Halogeometricum luteum TaxID=2950537 RepID=A0ABU2FZJ7_9EURY|nr:phosphoadenosine phosphosulfate reductase family protein [Halogeometricum sp. S3BR5-2]MDS0293348.1 phosphoadenosine phosphosulfate reductase family protein [Halogeometricum sp. S3BR5-2]
MTSSFPSYVTLDYDAGRGESAADYPTLEDKMGKAVEVTRAALEQYERPAVMWTGGKDSTVVLYVVREVAAEMGVDVPPVVFIDHFEHFPETVAFVERWTDAWDLDLVVAKNDDFVRLGATPGDEIPLSDLSAGNRRELERLEHEGETLTLDADSFEGNHLLKTVALNDVITEREFDGIFSGVRWDEQESRAGETFFSPRHDSEKYPPHDRVHSILQFEEADIWAAFWDYIVPDATDGYPTGRVPEHSEDFPEGIEATDIPVSPKYFEGFRSLGTESGSAKSDDRPAWVQDLGASKERAGRAQDKEDLMGRLRDLGYM